MRTSAKTLSSKRPEQMKFLVFERDKGQLFRKSLGFSFFKLLTEEFDPGSD